MEGVRVDTLKLLSSSQLPVVSNSDKDNTKTALEI